MSFCIQSKEGFKVLFICYLFILFFSVVLYLFILLGSSLFVSNEYNGFLLLKLKFWLVCLLSLGFCVLFTYFRLYHFVSVKKEVVEAVVVVSPIVIGWWSSFSSVLLGCFSSFGSLFLSTFGVVWGFILNTTSFLWNSPVFTYVVGSLFLFITSLVVLNYTVTFIYDWIIGVLGFVFWPVGFLFSKLWGLGIFLWGGFNGIFTTIWGFLVALFVGGYNFIYSGFKGTPGEDLPSGGESVVTGVSSSSAASVAGSSSQSAIAGSSPDNLSVLVGGSPRSISSSINSSPVLQGSVVSLPVSTARSGSEISDVTVEEGDSSLRLEIKRANKVADKLDRSLYWAEREKYKLKAAQDALGEGVVDFTQLADRLELGGGSLDGVSTIGGSDTGSGVRGSAFIGGNSVVSGLEGVSALSGIFDSTPLHKGYISDSLGNPPARQVDVFDEDFKMGEYFSSFGEEVSSDDVVSPLIVPSFEMALAGYATVNQAQLSSIISSLSLVGMGPMSSGMSKEHEVLMKGLNNLLSKMGGDSVINLDPSVGGSRGFLYIRGGLDFSHTSSISGQCLIGALRILKELKK